MRQLIDDSVILLRSRMAELGIEAENPVDLLNKAKEIVLKHKELHSKSASLQEQVNYRSSHSFHKHDLNLMLIH